MGLVDAARCYVDPVWGVGSDGYADYLLAVVSGFIFIVVTLTSTLWWQWWKHRRTDATQGDKESLRAWAAGELDTWQDRVKRQQRGYRNAPAHRGGRVWHDGIRNRAAFHRPRRRLVTPPLRRAPHHPT